MSFLAWGVKQERYQEEPIASQHIADEQYMDTMGRDVSTIGNSASAVSAIFAREKRELGTWEKWGRLYGGVF
jgi:hypothetical protein